MGFPFQTRLAIAAICKNEGQYIKEWLDYHLLAGADRFYIYDNESCDDTKKVLAPYIAQGLVEYNFWPGKVQQLAAYEHVLTKHRFDTGYLAFIDLDEFIAPRETRALPDIVAELLRRDPLAAAVAVNWRMFGSAGRKEPPPEVLTGFVRRAEDNFPANDHVKIIVNPRKTRYIRTPHHAIYTYGWHAVADDLTPVHNTHLNPNNKAKRLAVNHYFTKSETEWRVRRSQPRADNGSIRTAEEFIRNDRNEVFDDTAPRYWEARRRVGLIPPPSALPSAAQLLALFAGQIADWPKTQRFTNDAEELCCWLYWAIGQQDSAAQFLGRILAQILAWQMREGLAFWEFEMIIELVAQMKERDLDYGQEMAAAARQGLLQIIEHFRLEGDSLQEAYYWRRTQLF